MINKFDCIVIGAGPAGLTAALILARSGIKVAVIEKGLYPGSKNMFGGVLYCRELDRIIPNFREKAPVERPVVRWTLSVLNRESKTSLDYENIRFNQPPYSAFTVLRARFDQWFAGIVREAGAFIIPETLVEDFLYDKDKIVGVRTGRSQGELFADIVIAADGVNTIVRRKTRLLNELSADEVYLGIKEVLSTSEKAVEQKFNLLHNEGVAHTFIGDVTGGIPGGGFIYTNKNTISVGIVLNLAALSRGSIRPEELLDKFKSHPLVNPYLKEAEPREYSAHLIPELRFNPRTKYYADGLLITGDAAGFTLNTGLRLEGANLAVASGLAAAETVKIAREQGDYSSRRLSLYHNFLKKNGLLADLKKYRHAPELFQNQRLYKDYPALAGEFAEKVFSDDLGPRKGLRSIFQEKMKGHVTTWQFIKDVYGAWRALG